MYSEKEFLFLASACRALEFDNSLTELVCSFRSSKRLHGAAAAHHFNLKLMRLAQMETDPSGTHSQSNLFADYEHTTAQKKME
jgi:hypothetical protein